MGFRALDEAEVQGKRVLVRVDFNVPMKNGVVLDDTRLKAALPTINDLRVRGARTILLAHFDRPKGERVTGMSLRPVVAPLAALIGAPVAFAEDCVGQAAVSAVAAMQDGDIMLLENLRFHAGEEANDPAFARALAELGDIYVDDAFSAAHRAHASTEGIARFLPAFAGRAMQTELEHLEKALGSPQRPVIAIVGGAKVSTKIELLDHLVGKLQYLAIGGGMANTFLFAQGHGVGGSLCERDLADTARRILTTAQAKGCEILLPIDVVVADNVAPGVESHIRALGDVRPTDLILDAGPKSVERLKAAMDASRTLIWNGPLGVFEIPPFDRGTNEAARHAARLCKAGKLIVVAGGGDTVSALNAAAVTQDFTFISTAGGAFLEWMEGKTLPGVAALETTGKQKT